MVETVSCAISGQMSTNDNLKSFNTYSAAIGKSGNYYYTYALKFTVPEFAGKAEILNFSLILKSSSSSGHTLRGAVVDNLDNFSDYVTSRAPTGEVTDPHQVGSAVLALSGVSSIPAPIAMRIPVPKTIQPGTYYLILWAYTEIGYSVNDIVSGYGTSTAEMQINTYIGPVPYVQRGGHPVECSVYARRSGEYVPVQMHRGGATS